MSHDPGLRARAKSLLEDLHLLYGGAGTFTVEQLDGYAVDLIVKWATEEKHNIQQPSDGKVMERSKEEQTLILQTVRELDPRCGHPLFFAGFNYPCDAPRHHNNAHTTRVALVDGGIASLVKPLAAVEERILTPERVAGTISMAQRCKKRVSSLWFCMGPHGLNHICSWQYTEQGTSASCGDVRENA